MREDGVRNGVSPTRVTMETTGDGYPPGWDGSRAARLRVRRSQDPRPNERRSFRPDVGPPRWCGGGAARVGLRGRRGCDWRTVAEHPWERNGRDSVADNLGGDRGPGMLLPDGHGVLAGEHLRRWDRRATGPRGRRGRRGAGVRGPPCRRQGCPRRRGHRIGVVHTLGCPDRAVPQVPERPGGLSRERSRWQHGGLPWGASRRCDRRGRGGIGDRFDRSCRLPRRGVLPPRAPSGPPQPSLDFDGNYNFASLRPLVAQVFFIGDGRASDGAIQRFLVPDGATRLYLGVVDAFAFTGPPGFYGDNAGSFEVRLSFI